MQWLELDELNQRLALYGVEAFDEAFVTLGGGGHVEIGRIMLGGGGHGLLGQEQISGGFERELSGGFEFFDAGVMFVRESNWRAYVLVGLGGGGYELETNERSLPTFDDVMADPTRGSELSVGGFLVQGALGGDYIARFSRGDDHGISLGIRAGFTYAPSMGVSKPRRPEMASPVPTCGSASAARAGGWHVTQLVFGSDGCCSSPSRRTGPRSRPHVGARPPGRAAPSPSSSSALRSWIDRSARLPLERPAHWLPQTPGPVRDRGAQKARPRNGSYASTRGSRSSPITI